ncbi:uncharacterized protein MYCFIDRAFT_166678 [Pseudocercospora fijiensis CIRAD86]|uniref:C2H2-type domain-containing protein n=1 Tax=Pseudocercospora fijiensis (strain CIRAD86) TaxID=383855 RepID=M3AT86_PSEFD|nr:uncharacterized protein MYCFIDRAFT_166678 [Pseudocercospora fijiensis CIRAD86]EME80343.1 hypothetical protein MYCFIDRAFT_166678 [Pseudocercospora fijiensis CIRAD86]
MAATTRATTPSTFAALDGAPRTPTSILPGAGGPNTTSATAVENPSLLRPHAKAVVDRATASLSPNSDKAHSSPRSTPLPLTGAAAMAELKRRKQQQHHQNNHAGSRQTTPNPQVQAMQTLLGTGGMSRPEDAPAPNKMSEPFRKMAEKINVPENHAHMDSEQEVSPVSLGSFGSTLEGAGAGAGGNNAMTATSNDQTHAPGAFVAEPAQMTEGDYQHNNGTHLAVQDQDKQMSLSYPGPPPQSEQDQDGAGPSRSMTLPGFGQASPKSPAGPNKRHKCPYCATDFTRHHNLKSHLLTHSQEKPYVCQTCQARFRRLHDLKRHTKLHTGERPHTCDKCGRRFARGDALARHNKGPGGCAGRRASFGGDDEFGDGGEGMDGVEYQDDDEGTDEHGRRIGEPNRKRQQLETPQDPNRAVYRQHSSTYPPTPLFGEPTMLTSSPKPLSPGQPQDQHRLSVGDGSVQLGRNRSTSLTTQFQQQHFGRGSGARTPPQANAQFQQGAPHINLPPIGSTSQPQARGGMQAAAPAAMSGGAAPNVAALPQSFNASAQHGSNPGSLSSHGRSSGSSMRDLAGQEPNDLWGYVRQLEQKFGRMQDEYELRISRLQEELITLRGQVNNLNGNTGSYSSDMGRQGPYP